MSSKVKRTQLVNELRKAHFSLGFADNAGVESEYIQEYKEKEMARNGNSIQNKREHHYELGTDDPVLQSEFKERFPDYSGAQPAALSEDKKKDLRKQHFVLGYQQGLPDSTYTQEYYKKHAPIDSIKQQNNRRGHKHDFGDSLTYFSSVYKEAFNKNLEGFQPPQKVPIDQNSQRRTNMVLGNALPQYNTMNSTSYVNRSSSVTRPIKAAEANISLGNDNVGFQSSHKNDFCHKVNPIVKVDQEKIKDFRSAHFKLGSPSVQSSYQSENRGEYNEKPMDGAQKSSKPNDNVNLNMDYPNDYNSIYKGNFQGHSGEPTQPFKPLGQINSLGSDPSSFQSEAKASYIKRPFDASVSCKNTGDKCNLDLGNGETQYTTQHQDTYKDRFSQFNKNDLSKEEISDLKSKHFQHGYKDRVYDTTNGKYGKQQGPPSTLTPQQIQNMRKTHIYDADSDIKKNTTYKTSFLWKANKQY